MKNPCSIISADGKREKDKVSISNMTVASETAHHNNLTTPINNDHWNDGTERGIILQHHPHHVKNPT
eukprot:14675357-Ditylum_brightwellii.AAC.1